MVGVCAQSVIVVVSDDVATMVVLQILVSDDVATLVVLMMWRQWLLMMWQQWLVMMWDKILERHMVMQ